MLQQAGHRARLATFTAELQGKRLANLGQKEGASLLSQALRVLVAQSSKVEGERFRVQDAVISRLIRLAV